jgi:hypothetical protein
MYLKINLSIFKLLKKINSELGAFSPRHFPLPRGKGTFLKFEFLA